MVVESGFCKFNVKSHSSSTLADNKKSQEHSALGFFSVGKWETPTTRW